MIPSRINPVLSPRKGNAPVAISYKTTPKENKSVRAIQFLGSHLFRRHIGDGAQRAAGTRQMFLGLDGRGAHGNVLRLESDLRQSEIQNLGVSALGHKDVRRLDVAVDDAFCVGCVECIGDLNCERHHGFRIHRLSRNPVLQGQSVQKLHGDEGLSVLIVNLVDGADVGMVQCRGSFGFPLKAAEGLRIFGHVIGQELEGNKTSELQRPQPCRQRPSRRRRASRRCDSARWFWPITGANLTSAKRASQ